MSILSPHNQCCACFLRELNLPGEIQGKVILLIDILWSDYDVATWPYHKWFGSRKLSRASAFPVVSRIKASSLWSSSELALGYCVSRDPKPAIGSPMFSLFEDRWVLLPEIKPSKISKSNVRHRYFSQHEATAGPQGWSRRIPEKYWSKSSHSLCLRYLPVLLRGPFSPREGLKG